MKTDKIREALTVLGECVDAKLADAAMAELTHIAEADQRAHLRDTFASAALTGYVAHHGEPRKTSMDGPTEEEQRRVITLKMYRWADAMLAAREGK